MDTTRPNSETRDEEERDAAVTAGADREPTAEEERIADGLKPSESVAAHAKEALERGANQKGEGRI